MGSLLARPQVVVPQLPIRLLRTKVKRWIVSMHPTMCALFLFLLSLILALTIGFFKFPRVKVFLDSDDLEISADCQTLLDTIKTNNKPEDVATFRRKYGT